MSITVHLSVAVNLSFCSFLQVYAEVYYSIGLFLTIIVHFLSVPLLDKELLSKKPFFMKDIYFVQKNHNLFVPEIQIHKHSSLFM